MTDNPHHHTPFLRQVADIYAANESEHFSQLCFIFPNKRSATFFRHYLSENNGSGTAPNIRYIHTCSHTLNTHTHTLKSKINLREKNGLFRK